jgi:dipeptidyl aminopeptidase/acylaminoacyl peptidase
MKLSKIDRAALSLAAVLLLALAVVLWRGDQVGVPITSIAPAGGTQAAASAPIVIEFGQRMNAASVQAHFSVTPDVPGKFFWNENSMYFLSDAPLQEGQHYLVHLAKGAQGQIGHDLLADLDWDFDVRAPGIAFLRQAIAGYELWAQPDLKGDLVQLSPADGVFDYTVSGDGENLIFSVVNEESGIDLWIVSRNGGDARILLACGADRCFAPAASRTGRIAYSRVPAPLSPAEPYGPPRTWLFDARTGETVRLHADTQKIGYGPTWSPDAQHLAYYDGIASRIVVLDMRNGNETYLPSRAGVMGTWSPDGGQMLYYDTVSTASSAVNQIYRANFATQDVLPFFDPQPTDADYSEPVLSPDGLWVAIKVHPLGGDFSEQLWVVPQDGSYAMVAVDEPGYLYSSYSWSPDSQRLLYHRLTLGSAEREPQVWVWDRATATSTLLADEASAPSWLP